MKPPSRTLATVRVGNVDVIGETTNFSKGADYARLEGAIGNQFDDHPVKRLHLFTAFRSAVLLVASLSTPFCRCDCRRDGSPSLPGPSSLFEREPPTFDADRRRRPPATVRSSAFPGRPAVGAGLRRGAWVDSIAPYALISRTYEKDAAISTGTGWILRLAIGGPLLVVKHPGAADPWSLEFSLSSQSAGWTYYIVHVVASFLLCRALGLQVQAPIVEYQSRNAVDGIRVYQSDNSAFRPNASRPPHRHRDARVLNTV